MEAALLSYYDPATAQFLTPDPLFAITGERYGYAGNDPINGSDPLGLFWGEGTLKKAAHAISHYAKSWVPNRVTIGNNNCTSLGDTHETARDLLYVTAGVAATVPSPIKPT